MDKDKTVANFSSFGKKFQEKLAFLILDDRIFADRMMEVLRVEFFETKYMQLFVQKIFDYKEEFGAHPSRETMEMIIRSSMEKENSVLKKQVTDYYVRMITEQYDDSDFIKSQALDFSRKQKLHEAMIKSAPLLRANSFDEISKIINFALQAGQERDVGHDYIADFEERYVPNVRNPIATGWPKLDEATDGGLGRGEYGLVLAGTGAGKTFFLIHLAAEALKSGKKVLFYTLELSPAVIGLRFDACFSGIPIDELRDNKDAVLEKIKEPPGQLKIKRYSKKSVSMFNIKKHVEMLKQEGFKPDMIVLDYLDLLKPSSFKKELRHEIGESYDEFEALCQDNDMVGWTASQTNRGSFGSSTIQMDQTSEALNKNFGSYLTLGLARTPEDKTQNTGRLTICKNRNGPDGMSYNMFIDPAVVDFKILDAYDPSADIASLEDPMEMKRRMAEKYKKFKLGGTN